MKDGYDQNHVGFADSFNRLAFDVGGKKLISRAVDMFRNYAPPLFLFLTFLVVWYLVVLVINLPHYILPSPVQVLLTIIETWEILLLHTVRTALEVLVGLTLAMITGLGLAVCIVCLLYTSPSPRD